MQFHDYYQTMGVDENASDEEIKRAYRKLARKYHPDVSKEADAEEKFKAVNEAYEVLKNAEQRAAYDELRRGGYRSGEQFQPPPDWQAHHAGQHYHHHQFSSDDLAGFSDFFQSMFGEGYSATAGRSGAGRYQQAPMAQDIHASIEVSLEEAFNGATKRIHYERPIVDSAGQQHHERKTMDLSIPAGVAEGQHLRLKNLGASYAQGQNGDLYIEIHITPHSVFIKDGLDINLVLPLTPWEAALGCKVTTPTLGGNIALTIPPNTPPGKRFRLKGRGMPGSPPGDQYCTIELANPSRIDEQTRALYEQLAAQCDFNPREAIGG